MVTTALTRNQVTGNRPWVRIPPAPLVDSKSEPVSGLEFSIASRALRRSRVQLYTTIVDRLGSDAAGLHQGFLRAKTLISVNSKMSINAIGVGSIMMKREIYEWTGMEMWSDQPAVCVVLAVYLIPAQVGHFGHYSFIHVSIAVRSLAENIFIICSLFSLVSRSICWIKSSY